MFRDIQQLPCESGSTKIPMRRNQPTEAVAVEQSPLLMSIKASRAAANELMRVPLLSKTFLMQNLYHCCYKPSRYVAAESKYQGSGKRSIVCFLVFPAVRRLLSFCHTPRLHKHWEKQNVITIKENVMVNQWQPLVYRGEQSSIKHFHLDQRVSTLMNQLFHVMKRWSL